MPAGQLKNYEAIEQERPEHRRRKRRKALNAILVKLNDGDSHESENEAKPCDSFFPLPKPAGFETRFFYGWHKAKTTRGIAQLAVIRS